MILSVEASTYSSSPVNTSTRSLHTKLNKQILARLPLAIPPYSTSSSKYVSGLIHVAPIYFAFESLWQEIVDTPCEPEGEVHSVEASKAEQDQESNPKTETDQATPTHPRIHSLLSYLLLPSLLRSSALREDIQALTGFSTHEMDNWIKAASQRGNLADFITHIKSSIKRNPHVLLAYAWVLYMALFSGGRILRGVLKDAGGMGRDFWERNPSPVRPSHPLEASIREALQSSVSEDTVLEHEESRRGRTRARSEDREHDFGMGFFSFPGDEDGEDIKIEFKKRYADVELRLTPTEQNDVVEEGKHIFRFMLGLIEDLDSVMGSLTHESFEPSVLQRRRSFDESPESHPGYLDGLVKNLHLSGALDSMAKPLGMSFSHEMDAADVAVDGLKLFWLKCAALAVPAFGTAIVILAWKMGG